MAKWHIDRGKKPTGGRVRVHRKKRKRELGSSPMQTKIGKEKKKTVRMRGGGLKIKAAAVQYANVYDPENKNTQKVKILEIIKTPSDLHLARRGIITKGTIIQTEIGLVKVTSRPSQHGIINGILIEENT